MKKILLFLSFVLSLGLFTSNVYASSGKISVSSSSTAIVGNTLTVTVTLSSSSALGSWEFDINYDSSYLRLTSSSAENNGTYFVNYGNGSIKSKSYTLQFKVLKSGTTNITVGSFDVHDWDKNNMSITRANKKVTLMTQAELEASYSKDNNLKDLSVSIGDETYEFSPAFDKDTLEYSVDVPTGTTLINVKATKNDNTATIDGDGEIEVTEGPNIIPIVVTAQNGDKKTYTLTVNVLDQNPIEVEIDGKTYTVVKTKSLLTAPVTFTETTININDFEIPAFVNESISYTLVGLKDENGDIALYRYLDGQYSVYNEINTKSLLLIPIAFSSELDYIKTTVTINNETVDAYKYSENSPLFIINAINLEDGKTNLYLYDSVSNMAILFDESFINETNNTILNYTYVIIAFASALFLMLIVIIGLLCSGKKKQKKIESFILKQEAKIEATRKLNDVVLEVNKIVSDEKDRKVEKVFLEDKDNSENKNGLEQENNKSKKELKKEKKEAKKKAKEDKKRLREEFLQDEIKIEDQIKKIDETLNEDTGVYNIFEDDRKKKKKK